MSGKPYFHETFKSKEDFEKWTKEPEQAGKTWGDLQDMYEQPEWCCYPRALQGMMGCWALVGCRVTGEDSCRNCDQHKDSEDQRSMREEEKP